MCPKIHQKDCLSRLENSELILSTSLYSLLFFFLVTQFLEYILPKMCGFENSFSEKRFVFSSKNGHRVNDEDLMQIYMKQIAHRDIFYGSVCVA